MRWPFRRSGWVGAALFAAPGLLLNPAARAESEKSKFVQEIIKEVVKGVAVEVVRSGIEARKAPPAEPLVRPTPPSPPGPSAPVADEASYFGALAQRYFQLDAGCAVDLLMPMYADVVFYDRKDEDLASIRRTKLESCRTYGVNSSYSIRPGTMYFSSARADPRFKMVDYVVDYNVFNAKTNSRRIGTAAVRLVFDARSPGMPKIIGESHHRL